jgi:SAM-dependent methyltransferase
MYGLPMSVVLCATCELVYTNPRFSPSALLKFYDTEYRPLDRGVTQPQEDFFQLQWGKGRSILKYLVDCNLRQRIAGKAVIEIGCGAGGIVAYFREQGFTALGCDFNQAYLEYGLSRHGLDLHRGDLRLIKELVSERRLRVGLVIYEQVFEHLPYPKEELNALRPIMDFDSLLYICVPGLRNIDKHYDSDFLRYLQIPHLLHFELKSLARMVYKCGFSQICGDETIKALFEMKASADSSQASNGCTSAGYSNDLLGFLLAMERRRQIKALRRLPKNALLSLGYRVRAILRKLPLSPQVTQRIAECLSQTAKLLRISFV